MASNHQGKELQETPEHAAEHGILAQENVSLSRAMSHEHLKQQDKMSKENSEQHGENTQLSNGQHGTHERIGPDDETSLGGVGQEHETPKGNVGQDRISEDNQNKDLQTEASLTHLSYLEAPAYLQKRQSEFLQEIGDNMTSSSNPELDMQVTPYNVEDQSGVKQTEGGIAAISQECVEEDVANAQGQQERELLDKEIMLSTIKAWKKEDIFITKSMKAVQEKISTKDCVCVIGVPGAGKSTALHHAALSLERQGFIIYCISVPEHFFKNYDKRRKQVFILEFILYLTLRFPLGKNIIKR